MSSLIKRFLRPLQAVKVLLDIKHCVVVLKVDVTVLVDTEKNLGCRPVIYGPLCLAAPILDTNSSRTDTKVKALTIMERGQIWTPH